MWCCVLAIVLNPSILQEKNLRLTVLQDRLSESEVVALAESESAHLFETIISQAKNSELCELHARTEEEVSFDTPMCSAGHCRTPFTDRGVLS